MPGFSANGRAGATRASIIGRQRRCVPKPSSGEPRGRPRLVLARLSSHSSFVGGDQRQIPDARRAPPRNCAPTPRERRRQAGAGRAAQTRTASAPRRARPERRRTSWCPAKASSRAANSASSRIARTPSSADGRSQERLQGKQRWLAVRATSSSSTRALHAALPQRSPSLRSSSAEYTQPAVTVSAGWARICRSLNDRQPAADRLGLAARSRASSRSRQTTGAGGVHLAGGEQVTDLRVGRRPRSAYHAATRR